MNLSVSEIKEYVKNCLDEYSTQAEAELVTSDGAVQDLDRIIENAIVPAVRKIHLDAPNVLLSEGQPMSDHLIPIPLIISASSITVTPVRVEFGSTGGAKKVTVRSGENWSITTGEGSPDDEVVYSYYMYEQTLPSRFMRLVSLKLTDWDRPIQTLVNEDSAEYHKQRNKYLMGTPRRPIGALVRRNGSSVMELYSSVSSEVSLDYGSYIPEPAIEHGRDEDTIWVVETLRYPCLNQITANVLRSIGEFQKAAVFEEMAVQPFRIDPDYARLNPANSERINNITNQ